MPRWIRLVLTAFFIFGIILFRFSPHQSIPPTRSHHHVISPLSSFVHKVYLDKRGGSNLLRVLSINRCHEDNSSIISIKINDTFVPLVPRPIEGRCPWKWASGCSLATYMHTLELDKRIDLKEVILKGSVQYGVKPVIPVYERTDHGLTMCIPPMYWYTDWTKLIFFVEWWKRQNVTKIMFYHQSSTVEIKQVLEYYEKRGIVEIVPWSLLPSVDDFNPNDQVYRLGHSLAQNDCVLRSTTEFVTTVDVDEIIVPSHGTLMDTVKKMFETTSIGSVLFPHRVLLFYPLLAPLPFEFNAVNYDGIHMTVYKDISGPPKASDALLLHNRYNYAGVWTSHVKTPVKIVDNTTIFQKTLVKVKSRIFPNGAIFNEETQRILGACLRSWRISQNNCKAPATACFDVMKDRENWAQTASVPYVII